MESRGATIHTRAHTDMFVWSRAWSNRTEMAADQAHREPEYLKVDEVAARLKVKEKTVRDWIGRGQLEAYKIGKEWRIRSDHLDQALEARRVSAQSVPTGGLWDPDAAA
jgi:excisionase family DNA binding protein